MDVVSQSVSWYRVFAKLAQILLTLEEATSAKAKKKPFFLDQLVAVNL